MNDYKFCFYCNEFLPSGCVRLESGQTFCGRDCCIKWKRETNHENFNEKHPNAKLSYE